MPELRECVAFFNMVQSWFRKALQDDLDLRIINLVADAVDTVRKSTDSEIESKIDETLLAPDRLPFVLTPDCPQIMRGHTSNQHDAYPPCLRRSTSNPNPAPIQSYTMASIDKTMRSLILEFAGDDGESLWLKLSYLTHTCVQVYTCEQWDIIVTTPKPKASDKLKRRARIGLAIVFESYTLAFVSNDLLFEPIWKRTKSELPNTHLGVYDQPYFDYLQVVVDWMVKRKAETNRNTRKAWEAIKSTQEVFMGVGVYTSCELLFDAGIPPWISEAELADCPSRMARLCEALWAYAHRSFTELGKLISPAMAQGVLAPTQKQRLGYKTWLHVWAREYSHMPSRMKELAEGYVDEIEELSVGSTWYRDEKTDLYDIFDPYFIGAALSNDLRGKVGFVEKPVVLGDLIWPEDEWFAISGRSTPLPSNPLKMYYRDQGLINAPNFLKPSHYTNLGIRGIPAGKPNSSQVRFETYHYYWTKQFWTVFCLLPTNSRASRRIKGPTFTSFEEVTGDRREARYFHNIVLKSSKVAIGPLEYSASGTQARTTHGEKAVHPLRHATRDETLLFHRTSRSACSSAVSLVMNNGDSSEGDSSEGEGGGGGEEGGTGEGRDWPEQEHIADEEGEEGEEQPPETEASEASELEYCASESGLSDEGRDVDEDEDEDELVRPAQRASKRLPSDLFGSDCGDDDEDGNPSDGNPRPRKSRRSAKPKASYAFTKRGYAARRKD